MTSQFVDIDHHFTFHDQSQSRWDFSELLNILGQAIFSSHPGHGPVVGTPEADAKDWVPQTTAITCDVVSQEMILHEFGVNVSEAQLVYDAASHGWLTNGGTSPQDMAQLLEFHGVHTHANYDGGLDALMSELAQGHKVIVAVDSAELWNTTVPGMDWFSQHGADHAVVVTGLDMSNPSHPQVFINDPGDPHGAGKAYPLEQFCDAWNGSGNTFIATDSAPPHLAGHSIFGSNYHPETGMYMDKGFWESFLQSMLPGVAADVVAHHPDLWNLAFQPETAVNPWERMTGVERNELFLRI
jgi:hypothetical protein